MNLETETPLDFRLVRKVAPDGTHILALNLGRDYLETSIFIQRDDLLFLLDGKDDEESDTESTEEVS